MAAAFFSPSGIEALERLLSPGAVRRLRAEALALARGETTRAALESKGYRNAAVRAFDAAALEALQSMTRIGPRTNP